MLHTASNLSWSSKSAVPTLGTAAPSVTLLYLKGAAKFYKPVANESQKHELLGLSVHFTSNTLCNSWRRSFDNSGMSIVTKRNSHIIGGGKNRVSAITLHNFMVLSDKWCLRNTTWFRFREKTEFFNNLSDPQLLHKKCSAPWSDSYYYSLWRFVPWTELLLIFGAVFPL
jgi:hypothetical protein